MSTPLSSGAPRSSSLAVPATQNTAPVVKFRCLFTHDIRRKAKRWQDGFLRYHTFNKRVMVYDNTGYFIGDLHYRAPEGINDGDELELDKGVLIQVCEPLERTETDISSLYKNKSQVSPSRPGDAPPSSVRSAVPQSSLSSQQASRSLNDVLKIKKTSVPPLPSPYEQRHGQRPASSHQPHERPAKRQRITVETITSGQQDVVDLADSPPPRRQSASIQSRPNPHPTPQNQRTAVLPEPQRSTGPPPRQQSANTQSRPKPHSIPENQRTAALPEPQKSTGPQGTSEKQVLPSSSRPTAQSVSQNLKTSSSGAESSINTLRFPSSKPRRKLMYQESSLAPVKKSESQTTLSRTHSQRRTIEQAASSPIIILDDNSSKLDDDPIPDDGSVSDDDDLFLDFQTAVPHQETPAQVDSDDSLSRSHSLNNNMEDGVNLTASAPNPRATEHSSKPNNSNNPLPLMHSGPSLPNDQHSAKVLENIARPRSTGLRKSYSDPTTINSFHTRPLPTMSPLNPSVDKDDELGPWTSEALDLFDFWPPGRPKPA